MTQKELTTAIMQYEDGALDEESTIALFQHLVDTGLAWTLQGSYSRTAMHMLRSKQINHKNQDIEDWGL